MYTLEDTGESELADFSLAGELTQELARVLVGSEEAIHVAVLTLLAEGHLLVEDVPGVGKTTLAKALARSISGTEGRIQFTADLLPSDITGTNVLRGEERRFEFIPGPVFANVVIADEINRASPKTQSALMEAMQERQVTVDGVTRPVPRPFMVVATQNPVEMDGTYPLPEAQRDRFLARITIGYPAHAEEVAMLTSHERGEPVDAVRPVMTPAQLTALIESVRSVHLAPDVKDYIVRLAEATRGHADIFLGASPRASIQLALAARANAAIAGRRAVVPDDVQRILPVVWAHRLVASDSALARGLDMRQVLVDISKRVSVGL